MIVQDPKSFQQPLFTEEQSIHSQRVVWTFIGNRCKLTSISQCQK